MPIERCDEHPPDITSPPIYTSSPFPFANCCHRDWTVLTVRVRRPDTEGWEEAEATTVVQDQRRHLNSGA